MSDAVQNYSCVEIEERLLYSSRHGDFKTVQEILTHQQQGFSQFQISCKG